MNRDEREALARAAKADEILNHPLISEALSSYEQELTEEWLNTNRSDAAGRERIWCLMEAQKRFRQYLNNLSTTGQLIRIKANPSLVQKAGGMIRRALR